MIIINNTEEKDEWCIWRKSLSCNNMHHHIFHNNKEAKIIFTLQKRINFLERTGHNPVEIGYFSSALSYMRLPTHYKGCIQFQCTLS